jgi:LmeA-like phospholipid-binding
VRRLIALAVAGVVLLVLIVAQLTLPTIAEQELRDQLSQSGTVLQVKVSAFPAIKLLWHQADSVVVRMGRYGSGAGALGYRLGQTAGVSKLDASVHEFHSGALRLHEATLRKRGSELTGSATVMNADLRAAVPFLDNVQPIASGGGRLTLRGTASLLGLRASVDATVAAQDGALVVAPNVPFGGIATITLFNNPHVRVQSVSALAVPGGFRVSAQATVH